jgi:hypothetical protein
MASARSVVCPAGMVGRLAWVEKIVVPFLWTSTITLAPTGAEPTEARTAVMVTARPGYQRNAPVIGAERTPLAGEGDLLAVLRGGAVLVVGRRYLTRSDGRFGGRGRIG